MFEYAKCTYVEGSYGNRKNGSTENYRRGHHRADGVGTSMLLSIASIAVYNLRMYRNWNDRTGLGDPNNPLLTADPDVIGYRAITEDEYTQQFREAS